MDIQTLSRHSFLIYIDPEEMARRSLSPAGVGADDALAIIAPLVPCGDAVVELFPGRDDLLIFVRCGGVRSFFVFDGFEHLAAAAGFCSGDEPSALRFADGRYILSVRCRTESDIPAALFEFGERAEGSDEWAEYLDEHALTVIPHGAIGTLRAFFDT